MEPIKGLKGEFLTADASAEAYNAAIVTFNAMGADIKPKVVVRCADADDVVLALAYAKKHSLNVSLKCGGHQAGYKCLCDGMVIELTLMQAVSFDDETRILSVQGGCLLNHVNVEADKHKVAIVTGTIPVTGIAGLSLGGGYGYLSRSHGLAIDNIVEFDVVLADGTKATVNSESHPDLFWALRGAGANYAAVTNFKFNTYPVHQCFGGSKIYNLTAPQCKAFLKEIGASFMKLKDCRSKTQYVALMSPPGMTVMLAHVYVDTSGDTDETCLDNFDKFKDFLLDPAMAWRPLTFLEMQNEVLHKVLTPPPGQPGPPPARQYWKGGRTTLIAGPEYTAYMDNLAEELSSFDFEKFPFSIILVEQWGGAINDVPPEATLASRGTEVSFVVVAATVPKEDDENRKAYARGLAQRINEFPGGDTGMYVNYITDFSAADSVAEQYGGDAQTERARAVKAKYDPDNVFSREHFSAAK